MIALTNEQLKIVSVIARLFSGRKYKAIGDKSWEYAFVDASTKMHRSEWLRITNVLEKHGFKTTESELGRFTRMHHDEAKIDVTLSPYYPSDYDSTGKDRLLLMFEHSIRRFHERDVRNVKRCMKQGLNLTKTMKKCMLPRRTVKEIQHHAS